MASLSIRTSGVRTARRALRSRSGYRKRRTTCWSKRAIKSCNSCHAEAFSFLRPPRSEWQRVNPCDRNRPAAAVLRLQPEEHVLLLCVHHIVFDGWSEAVFIQDFMAIYAALREGRDARVERNVFLVVLAVVAGAEAVAPQAALARNGGVDAAGAEGVAGNRLEGAVEADAAAGLAEHAAAEAAGCHRRPATGAPATNLPASSTRASRRPRSRVR